MCVCVGNGYDEKRVENGAIQHRDGGAKPCQLIYNSPNDIVPTHTLSLDERFTRDRNVIYVCTAPSFPVATYAPPRRIPKRATT